MQSIPESIPFIKELIEGGKYGTILIVVILSIVINIKNIFNFVDEFKKNRLSNINSALSDERLSSEMKSQLTSELTIEYFYLIYGVRLSTPMINAVLLLNERTKKSVSFKHLIIMSKFSPSIKGVEQDSYRVKLDTFDRVQLIYNTLLGVSFLSLGLLLFIFCLLSFQETHYSVVLLSVFIMLLGFLFLREARAFLLCFSQSFGWFQIKLNWLMSRVRRKHLQNNLWPYLSPNRSNKNSINNRSRLG
ncbi:hypothetical protein [Photobacterium leiognathi]|uniref:hypothetical protein n=1 Tax=Photobacterium leiognathi TaxID=553611 RepID=UPI002980B537|nr:hypothetical protein [Photobacterium leiognathi]